MEGIIVNYRRGRKTQTTNQMIVLVPGTDSKETAEKLVGKTVTYVCEGKAKKEITGTISAIHGGKGAVRVHFITGMPGQAIGGSVKIN
ncbi:MAG: 50S ribosomal protein L35ae [Candidatus Woesearchaeota archaeon]|jgi:ribosomal protein L35AE/L33A|nr:50S ribosomal protein L35ae [Candidatus Woesearchaeota archaeon]